MKGSEWTVANQDFKISVKLLFVQYLLLQEEALIIDIWDIWQQKRNTECSDDDEAALLSSSATKVEVSIYINFFKSGCLVLFPQRSQKDKLTLLA